MPSSPPPDFSLSGGAFCLIFVPYLHSSWRLCGFLCTNITSVQLLDMGCCQYFAVIDKVLAFYTWQIRASGKQILRMGECICNSDIFQTALPRFFFYQITFSSAKYVLLISNFFSFWFHRWKIFHSCSCTSSWGRSSFSIFAFIFWGTTR